MVGLRSAVYAGSWQKGAMEFVTRHAEATPRGAGVTRGLWPGVARPYARRVKREPELVDRIGILRPLRIRDFRLLWTGMTVSMVGDGIYLVAVAWQAYEVWHEASALAAVGLAWSIPQFALLMFSGVLSDRLDRRHLMIAGDAIRFVAICAVGLLSLADELTLPRLVGERQQ